MVVQQFRSMRGCLSYIIFSEDSRKALLIDPTVEIDDDIYLSYLKKNELELIYIAETHTHADHISSNRSIREKTGAQIVMHELSPTTRKDVALHDGDVLQLGKEEILVRYTPGHTNEHVIYVADKMVFTGDTLLISGTGRTDFQLGDSEALYDSLWKIIIPLGDDVVVYPGHDYNERESTTIELSKNENPRLQFTRDEFIAFMNNYKPDLPELFDQAIDHNTK